MVAAGYVKVKGEEVDDASMKVAAEDVTVRGQPLEAPDGLFVIWHKPLGLVCTHADGDGKSIYEVLPQRWRHRNPPVTSVGRLDKDTSGVLLLTDQGPLVHRFTSPKAKLDKVYEVTVDQPLEERLVPLFAEGSLMLESETHPCAPATLELTGPCQARLTLVEGRYHQVRRMFASQGWHVTELHRSRFGPYTLEGLAPGEWRFEALPTGA